MSMKKIFLILLALLILFVVIGQATAADDDGVNTNDVGSFEDLQKLIDDNYDKTITLDKNYTNNNNTEVINITGNITIYGNGYTINANGSGIFNIGKEKISFKLYNVKLMNAADNTYNFIFNKGIRHKPIIKY